MQKSLSIFIKSESVIETNSKAFLMKFEPHSAQYWTITQRE